MQNHSVTSWWATQMVEKFPCCWHAPRSAVKDRLQIDDLKTWCATMRFGDQGFFLNVIDSAYSVFLSVLYDQHGTEMMSINTSLAIVWQLYTWHSEWLNGCIVAVGVPKINLRRQGSVWAALNDYISRYSELCAPMSRCSLFCISPCDEWFSWV